MHSAIRQGLARRCISRRVDEPGACAARVVVGDLGGSTSERSLLGRARRRLPRHAPRAIDNSHLVQETLQHTLANVTPFQFGQGKALWAYLLCAVKNRVRDELRRRSARATSCRQTRFATRKPPHSFGHSSTIRPGGVTATRGSARWTSTAA